MEGASPSADDTLSALCGVCVTQSVVSPLVCHVVWLGLLSPTEALVKYHGE